MHRVALRYPGEGVVSLGCLPPSDRELLTDPKTRFTEDLKNALRLGIANGANLREVKNLAGEFAMDIAIEESEGNLQAAARRLGVTDRVLQLHKAGRKEI